MARKRSGRHGGGSRRSKAYRTTNFRATCSSCGLVIQVPVRPPPGVELQCVNCLSKNQTSQKEDESATTAQ